MLIAVKDEARSRAYKGAAGFECPGCGAAVIPKCGSKNIHHWAHKSGADCDTWSETEGEWHLAWKDYFPDDWLEITMGENNEHRSDVRRPDGKVIELQHSAISFDEALERQTFYGDMIWIFDAHTYIDRCSVLSWWRQHPPIYSWSYPDGRPSSQLSLADPQKIINRNKEFHSVEDKFLLNGVKRMDSLPLTKTDINPWRKDIRDIKNRISDCKEKLSKFSDHPRKVSEWSKKLKEAEKKIRFPFQEFLLLRECLSWQ